MDNTLAAVTHPQPDASAAVPHYRYAAFISYCHADAAFARRLQRKLETYRLPHALAPAARTLRPIFRDRDELTASADLTQSVRDAIAESAAMIVVCSPEAATSAWVAREITLFRHLHGPAGILAAIARGTPETAFPPALLEGGPGDAHREPLAADFRREGDGGRLAYLKLVAALAGVPLDALLQRDAHRRIRRISLFAALSCAGMVITVLLAAAALNARNLARHEQARGAGVIDYMLTDLRGKLQSEGRLDLLKVVNDGALKYYAGQTLSNLPAGQLMERAKLLLAIAQDDDTRGDEQDAEAQIGEARRTTEALVNAAPNDAERILAHAQSEFWYGYINWRLGNIDSANDGFRDYVRLTEKLLKLDPDNPDYLTEAGEASNSLGTVVLRETEDVTAALALYSRGLDYYVRARKHRPGDKDLDVDIENSYACIAGTQRIANMPASAMEYREKQRRALDDMLAKNPKNLYARSAIPKNLLGIARIELSSNNPKAALRDIQDAYKRESALAAELPDNKEVASQARMLELFEVRASLALPAAERPDLAEAQRKLGDCNLDRKRRNGTELWQFCSIQQARLLKVQGKPDDAAGLISSLQLGHRSGFRLTERWLLDLDEEAKLN
jgi:tetratricopeptide (TPR) repeat protein